MSTHGEAVAKAAFKAAHHADHQPHQPSLGFHEIDLQVGTPQGAPPKVEVLRGKLLITAEGQAQPQEVQLPAEAYTNEITAKWNASTAKLHVRIMLKDPNSPAMLEKQALDPDGPHPKPVEVQVTGRPLTRPPDVVGHGQPTPAQASMHGASTSPAIVGAPAHARMPDAGLAGTVASDMPTLVHKGGALEAPCSGETVVRDYETADTRLEVAERAIKDTSKLTAGMGRMEVGSQAVGQGADVAQLRKAHEPEQRDMARGRTLAPAGATIIQGARERRLEAEFETSDPSYLSAARTAMGLPQDTAPEHGAPTAVVPGGDDAGLHKVGGAEAAPERDGVDFDLLKQEGGFPTPSEAAQGVPLGMEGAAVRAAGEDLPETTPVHTAGGIPTASQLEGEDSMSSDGAPEVGAGGALTVADAVEAPGKPVMVTEPQPHALAPAGEADALEGEEEDYEDEYEESEEEGGEYIEEFEDEHGVRHVSTDPTKEKVGLATHALTAAERYPRCDDGSVEPVSSTKHQLETGGHGCDVCCCSPCQCGKLRTGQYKESLELSPAETKRMGKPAMHKTKKPDTGKKPLKHTKRDCRMHARTANAAQPHMSMAARTTAWTGDVPQDPAPGLTISAEEVEQGVLHKGSSLRHPDKAREAVQAAIGAHNDNEVVHGAKHHESTYTGGRVIGTGPNIHLSTGRHDKK